MSTTSNTKPRNVLFVCETKKLLDSVDPEAGKSIRLLIDEVTE
jgi:hypothetical protein